MRYKHVVELEDGRTLYEGTIEISSVHETGRVCRLSTVMFFAGSLGEASGILEEIAKQEELMGDPIENLTQCGLVTKSVYVKDKEEQK